MERRLTLTFVFVMFLIITTSAQRDTTYYLYRNGIAKAFTFQKLTSREQSKLSYYPAYAMDDAKFRYIRKLLEHYVMLESQYDSALRVNRNRDSLLLLYEEKLKAITSNHEARAANYQSAYQALLETNRNSLAAVEQCEAIVKAQRRANTRRIISYSLVSAAAGVIVGVLVDND